MILPVSQPGIPPPSDAQQVQRLGPDADACGFLSGGVWGCI